MFFSIIIPSYNRAAFLPRAINSIIAQSYTTWELIVVDDGSTDNTKDIILPFLSDSRIIYHYQKNAERSAARNKGISLSKGDFITFMDSDEYMDSDRLEKLYTGIKEHKFQKALYFTDIRFEFPDPKYNYIRMGRKITFPVNPDELIRIIIGNPQFCASREVLINHQFNPSLNVGEDMELLFRIAKNYPLIYLEDNATITEIEHENRSVSYHSISNIRQINTFKIMFSKGHPAYQVSAIRKNQKWSEVYLRAAYYYIFKADRIKAIYYTALSIFHQPKDKLKFKVNLMAKLSLRTNFNTIKTLFV